MSFFFIFSSFLFIIYLYTGFRLIRFPFKTRAGLFCWIALFLPLASLSFHIYLWVNFIYSDFAKVLASVGYISLGIVSCLFCLCFFRDLLIIVSLIFLKTKQFLKPSDKSLFFNAERRRFLFKTTQYSILGLSSTASAYGYFTALQEPKIVQVNINPKDDYKKLKGLKIVQFTDLHAGTAVKHDYVKLVCNKINYLKPDIIVFTGDLADGSPKVFAFDVSSLAELYAPYGKYFVTGNHEYYFGVEQWIKHVKTLGFEPLINEHRMIKYNNRILTLAGVTDIRADNFLKDHYSSPKKAIQKSVEKSFKLLCAHHPKSIYKAADNGFDLQISGHTHGGQYFPFNHFVKLEHPFVKGQYQYQNTQLYVSQGTGYWGPPLRLGTFPEITLFKFV